MNLATQKKKVNKDVKHIMHSICDSKKQELPGIKQYAAEITLTTVPKARKGADQLNLRDLLNQGRNNS